MLSNCPSSSNATTPNPLRKVLSRSRLFREPFKTPPPSIFPTSTSQIEDPSVALKRRLSLRRPSSSKSRYDENGRSSSDGFSNPPLRATCSQERLPFSSIRSNRNSIKESNPPTTTRLSFIHESKPHHSSSSSSTRPLTPFNLFLSNSSFISSSHSETPNKPSSNKFGTVTSTSSRPSTPSTLLPAWNDFWNGGGNAETSSIQGPPRKLQRKASDESFFCRGDFGDGEGTETVQLKEANSLWLSNSGAPPRPARPHSCSLFWDDEEAMADRSDFDSYQIQSQYQHATASRTMDRFYSPTASIYSISTASSSLSLDAYSCPSPTSTSFPSSPTCPPSPCPTVRLNLNFSKSNLQQEASLINLSKPLLISNSASVLDLKELIVRRLSSKGIALTPGDLTLSVQPDSLNQLSSSYASNSSPKSKSGLHFSPRSRTASLLDKVRGRPSMDRRPSTPSDLSHAVLTSSRRRELSNDRLVCEEGLLEDDEVSVFLKNKTLTWI